MKVKTRISQFVCLLLFRVLVPLVLLVGKYHTRITGKVLYPRARK